MGYSNEADTQFWYSWSLHGAGLNKYRFSIREGKEMPHIYIYIQVIKSHMVLFPEESRFYPPQNY